MEHDLETLDNPYTTGVRLSSDDYKLIEMGLTGVAHAAKEQGNQKMHFACMRLIERLQQCTIAGEGVPDELAKSFAERFQKALMEQNHKAIISTFRRWLATLIRLEPDPAKSISEKVTEVTFMNASQANAQVGISLLDFVTKKLTVLESRYTKGLPDDVLDYLKTWVAHGKQNLLAGHDPWAGDSDVE